MGLYSLAAAPWVHTTKGLIYGRKTKTRNNNVAQERRQEVEQGRTVQRRSIQGFAITRKNPGTQYHLLLLINETYGCHTIWLE